jgi:chromosome segregation ATPase
MSACSGLQAKLEKAEARLKIHKSHEEALADRCESLSAALAAHRAGESEAVQIMRTEMAAYVEGMKDYNTRYQELDQEHQLLQSKFLKTKRRCEQLNEQ